MSVNKGEIYGFLGANGVGKTTLLKCIFHFIKPDHGSIELFGTSDYYHQRFFSRIGYAPEVTNLYSFLTGRELLTYMAKLPNHSKLHLEEMRKRGNEEKLQAMTHDLSERIDALLAKL